ncbi:MAG TPA: hemerythrin domain-containing protein [Gammaproteobacteria bacterium]|nr:hemerythrin domain-containing protein [Gammaproteobacteria bacterium]
METISSYMEGQHLTCDEFFVDAERAVSEQNWAQAQKGFNAFHRAIEHHFAMEEEVLFPAVEEIAGTTMGPTQVMRMEHDQMRGLFSEMEQALAAKDADSFLGAAETLLVLMQQHNAKEEQIVYPMSDQLLASRVADVLSRMQAIASS